MKAPQIKNPMPCGFDPETTAVCPKDPAERALWAGIKHRHIVSQHFNGNVRETAKRLAFRKPKDYEAFKALIQNSPLAKFGTRMTDRSKETLWNRFPVLDDEFWQQMWRFVSGEETLELVQEKEQP